MRYKIHSFRNAEVIFENDERYMHLWNDVKSVLDEITDQDIINKFENSDRENQKSISDAINVLIDERLVEKGWNRQSPIFNDSEYRPTSHGHWWTLDFSKEEISIEVAFNHGEAVAWNLIKPVLAGELNHVEKAAQTSAGIIITATDALKNMGNFDGSVGTYEKFLQYLNPFRNVLTVPMIIIGLDALESFYIDGERRAVQSIEFYRVPKHIVLQRMKERLEFYRTSFLESTQIIRNRQRIPMSIKVAEKKIAVMTKENFERHSRVLENEDWHVFTYDDVNSYNRLDSLCEEISSYLV